LKEKGARPEAAFLGFEEKIGSFHSELPSGTRPEGSFSILG
jgi:hypothetical protein